MFPVIPDFLKAYIPSFKINLTDLTTTSDNSIKAIGANFIVNTFLALKYSRDLKYLLTHF